ncbi:hypothetical protein Clacol_000821 [Clathrus columnatus]|uniref:HD domain-containing protein n=1 Tax=Clathrus columnatus TaxID=1419009 RepID=A0AAV4ZZN5_9AGAM|nr:hypothetical protein Clacol_000821 [Clathrus columnatus]
MGTAEERIDELLRLLEDQGNGDYIGEAISQLEHCLQAANLAKISNADNDTIVAALLHDVGQFIPQDTEALLYNGEKVGRRGHEVIGANYLRSLGFNQKVCQLVEAHVIAKRYLCAVSPSYHSGLSPASQKSLVLQGGPFTPDEVEQFESDPLWREKVQLRKWDDEAKVPGMHSPDLRHYRSLMLDSLIRV